MKRRRLIVWLSIAALALTVSAIVASGVLPYRVFIVHTGSMSPTIPSTSAVIVREGVYRVGQPISFTEQGTVITHRLMRINPNGTIDTKGDANATDDPWHVKTSAIIGGVVAAPAHLGYWLMFLKNPLGLASIALSVIVCWLLWSFTGTTGPPTPMTRRELRAGRHRKRGEGVVRPAHVAGGAPIEAERNSFRRVAS